MLTYPGYDTPDGRPLDSPTSQLLNRLQSGGRLVLNVDLSDFEPDPHGDLPPNSPDSMALVLYDPRDIWEEARQEVEARDREILRLLELVWNELQRRAKEEAARLKREQEELKLQQEAERKRREEIQKEIQSKQVAREADCRLRLDQLIAKADRIQQGTVLDTKLLTSTIAALNNMKLNGQWSPLARGLDRASVEFEAFESLSNKYKFLIASLNWKPSLDLQFNARLTHIATRIALAPAEESTRRDLNTLATDIHFASMRHAQLVSQWNAALEATEGRISFITTQRDKKNCAQRLDLLCTSVMQDPANSNNLAALTLLNDNVKSLVIRSIKTERRKAKSDELINEAIRAFGQQTLNPKKYESLQSHEKALIRAVRNGDPLNFFAQNYFWERKAHIFSGQTAPALNNSFGGHKFEYRYWNTTRPAPPYTTRDIGGVTYYLTGERMTSYGKPHSEDIVFFHCQHPGSNAYKYGVVTQLPIRWDKTPPKPSDDTYLPAEFPALPTVTL